VQAWLADAPLELHGEQGLDAQQEQGAVPERQDELPAWEPGPDEAALRAEFLDALALSGVVEQPDAHPVWVRGGSRGEVG
jgi:hypothetical protein